MFIYDLIESIFVGFAHFKVNRMQRRGVRDLEKWHYKMYKEKVES